MHFAFVDDDFLYDVRVRLVQLLQVEQKLLFLLLHLNFVDGVALHLDLLVDFFQFLHFVLVFVEVGLLSAFVQLQLDDLPSFLEPFHVEGVIPLLFQLLLYFGILCHH